MKRILFFLITAGVAFAIGWAGASRWKGARHAAEQVAWLGEKASFEDALNTATLRSDDRPAAAAPVIVAAAPKSAPRLPTAQELLQKLKAMRIVAGPGQSAAVRQAIVLFDQLAQFGPDALPSVRQFLASNQDVDYDWGAAGKGPLDLRSLTDPVLAPSLRFGLFEVVRKIGGETAEKLLAGVLTSTGRGVEVAYLARVLEEIAPGKYSEAALTVARDLLAKGAPVSNSPLDRAHRDYLYDVLKLHHDNSYAVTAQSQLIQPDGKLDRSALRYLQQTLGQQSVAIAAQAYQDPRVTDADAKEPLARLALAFVGVDPQAAQLFHSSIFDSALTPDHRRELVEDLNQDGLSSKKTPSPEDLQIIQRRFELTQTYLKLDYVQQDPLLLKAFNEADKDLRKLLERAAAAAAVNLPPGGNPVR